MFMLRFLVGLGLALLWACGQPASETPNPQAAESSSGAGELAQKLIIVDTHVDLPYRLTEDYEDVSQRTARGDMDYPRAKAGGLNAPFMSIFTPAELQDKPGESKALAEKLIGMVEELASHWPDKFAVATSVADVKAQFEKGLVSLPMGMENGAPIETDLANLKFFYDRGIRYITLTHGKNNQICDSSYDSERTWHGLSPFGREVVAEMNRLGIMVDVSHVSDETFFQVMEVSMAPVIASHSSCRAFTPGFERNMSDEMIKLLAAKNGIIMINFGSSFINDDYRKKSEAVRAHLKQHFADQKWEENDPLAVAYRAAYIKEHLNRSDIKEVVAHIDHVVKLAGIDAVGLGSDFDGVGDSLPEGLRDVSQYPNLIGELLKAGYSEADIAKICSGNIFRVWSAVEAYAREAAEGPASAE